MFSALSKLKSIVVSLAFTVGCGGAGLGSLAERLTWETPTARSCRDVEALTPGARVTLSDCEGLPALAVVETKRSRRAKTSRTESAELPIRAAGDEGQPRLVLSTRSAWVLDRLEQVLVALNDQSTTAEQLPRLLQPMSMGTFTARVEGSASKELRERLGAGAVHLKETDADPPSVLLALFSLLCGAFWALACVARVKDLVTPEDTSAAAS